MIGWPFWMLNMVLGGLTWLMRGAFFLGPQTRHIADSAPLTKLNQPVLLRFAFPAVLAALIASALFTSGQAFIIPTAQCLAGGVGLLVAILTATRQHWRKHCVVLTLSSGMGTLWLLILLGL